MLRIVSAIGWVSFREIVRDKILYNILICSFFLLIIAWLTSKLTFVRPDRVILDFGLSVIALSCSAIAILTGASLVARELEKRTIQVALSRPITRAQFVFGKFIGLAFILFLNWVLLSACYLVLLAMISESSRALITTTLGVALFLVWIQSLVIASISVLISTISTVSLTVMLSVGLYLIGNNISELQLAAVRLKTVTGRSAMYGIVSFLPNFEHFNLGTQVIYGLPVSGRFVCTSVLYGGVLVMIALWLAGLLIQVREV